ncbi:GNAT family N-acetyltransferase [Kitasatospora viridis]|uniref:Acetyltransferase (GNAT) family protein n=1 Tax=Kitasatospora viridis TaxID=281105 RepID=A0A561S955_9ACTN|nr:GNAT family N-acetyltransferase [Kitasatospora viridis]TWF71400.1 acetyltransferase (GNAT) family protein [Kitasatospora viridis]
MNASSSTPEITRVEDLEWQALANGEVIGRADACRRPDGRLFVSIDTWQAEAFEPLAAAVLADLPETLYTVADETDQALAADWTGAGFRARRREHGYLVPTAPQPFAQRPAPAGVTVVPVGGARADLLTDLDRRLRAEIAAGLGWDRMPAEILPRPAGTTVVDPTKYAVAELDGEYVGLIRLAPFRRQPRIGLLAVRADQQRRGIGRTLLAHALGELHRAGTEHAWAEVDETNAAAIALIEGAGARRSGGNLEFVHRR